MKILSVNLIHSWYALKSTIYSPVFIPYTQCMCVTSTWEFSASHDKAEWQIFILTHTRTLCEISRRKKPNVRLKSRTCTVQPQYCLTFVGPLIYQPRLTQLELLQFLIFFHSFFVIFSCWLRAFYGISFFTIHVLMFVITHYSMYILFYFLLK